MRRCAGRGIETLIDIDAVGQPRIPCCTYTIAGIVIDADLIGAWASAR
jgi:hypothetical protein